MEHHREGFAIERNEIRLKNNKKLRFLFNTIDKDIK
jgi:hypothetical protein